MVIGHLGSRVSNSGRGFEKKRVDPREMCIVLTTGRLDGALAKGRGRKRVLTLTADGERERGREGEG